MAAVLAAGGSRLAAGVAARYAARQAVRQSLRIARSNAARTIQRAWRSSLVRGAAISGAASLSNRLRSRIENMRNRRMPFSTERRKKPKSGKKTEKQKRYGAGPKTFANGTYGGRFRRTKRIARPSKYLTKGFSHTHEVHGIVTDPDCVYIGMTAISSYVGVELVAQALLRRLFEKCIKQPIQNIKSPIQGYHNSGAAVGFNSDGFKIQLESINLSTGASIFIDYETQAPTDSIYEIVGEAGIPVPVAPRWPGLMTALHNWCTKNSEDASNIIAPGKLHIYRKDGNAAAFWVHSGAIDLRTVRVHMFGKAEMKLQNRTLAADAGNDAGNVTSNPLIGYQYEFNGSAPAFKDIAQTPGSFRIARMLDVGGVVTARGASMTAAGDVLKEPPKPQFFMNCVKSSRITLDPGSLKYDTVSYGFHKSFVSALKTIGFQNAAASISGQQYRNNGRSKMFALEDMINVNALQNIAIAYEINRQTMCYITEHPNTSAQGYFRSQVYNDTA